MTLWTRVRAWMTSLVGRARFERQMATEFRFHVDHRAEELMRAGLSENEAHRQARLEFGSIDARKEDCRASLGLRLVDQLRADLRDAFRTFRRSPGFTLVAVVTLALGIGPNSAIFAAVDAVVFRPLPYREPDRLMSLWTPVLPDQAQTLNANGDTLGGNGNDRFTISPADFKDYRNDNPVFSELAGFASIGANLIDAGLPERLFGEKVSANFFTVLGVGAAEGRTFVDGEDQPGHDQLVVLTHDLWMRRFGSDPTLLGRTILLDDRAYQVIGILPAGFKSPFQLVVPEDLSFYVPAAYSAAQLADRTTFELNVVGRLRPGVNIDAARSAMDAISLRLERAFPATNKNIRVGLAPLRDDIASAARTPMLALAGAVGLILLIACTNLANLLVARAVDRQREVTIRFALGATRARVMRSLLVHHAALAMLGCTAGLIGGAWTTALLVRRAPEAIPRLDSAVLDGRVMAFTAAVSLLTALLFGLIPAWHASRSGRAVSLKSEERTIAGANVMRWRSALMVLELSVSMMLLVSAGLLLRSFLVVRGVDVGFDATHVVAMNVNLPQAHYATPEAREAFFEELRGRVAALPGVEAAAFANRMPVRGGWSTTLLVDQDPNPRDTDGQAVSPDYFRTLGIPVLRGRSFTAADRNNTLPVVVVNAAFAAAYLPGVNPIDHRVGWATGGATPWMTIVGIVANVHRGGQSSSAGPQAYFPAAQTSYPVRLADFAFRAAGDPKDLIAAVKNQVWAVDRNQPVTRVELLDDLVRTTVAPRAFEAVLIAGFAGLALVLALVGVYGVVSYSVAQRTREIGLRLALGASRTDIVRLLVIKTAILIGAGIGVGSLGAWVSARGLAALLFQIGPTDPLTYGGVALLLAIVSLAACGLPAWRILTLDPTRALRQE